MLERVEKIGIQPESLGADKAYGVGVSGVAARAAGAPTFRHRSPAIRRVGTPHFRKPCRTQTFRLNADLLNSFEHPSCRYRLLMEKGRAWLLLPGSPTRGIDEIVVVVGHHRRSTTFVAKIASGSVVETISASDTGFTCFPVRSGTLGTSVKPALLLAIAPVGLGFVGWHWPLPWSVDRQILPLHQACLQTAAHDLFEYFRNTPDWRKRPCRFLENVE